MKRVYSIIVVLLAALSVTLPQSVDAAAPTKASAPAKSTVPAKKGTKAQPPSAVGQLLEAIRKRGTIVVGIAPQVPWVIRDPAGEWQGYEIDVARQLASDLGVETRACPRSVRPVDRRARGRQSRHRQCRLLDHAAAGARRRSQQSLCDIGNAGRRTGRSRQT